MTMRASDLAAMSDDELDDAADAHDERAEELRAEIRVLTAQINALEVERRGMPERMVSALGDAKAMRAVRDRANEAPFDLHALDLRRQRLTIEEVNELNASLTLREEQQRRELAVLEAAVRAAQETLARAPTFDYKGDRGDNRARQRKAEELLYTLEHSLPGPWVAKTPQPAAVNG